MRTYLLMAMVCVLACGCGVKPGEVDPPESIEHDTFPQTYPDLSTDPHPEILQTRPLP